MPPKKRCYSAYVISDTFKSDTIDKIANCVEEWFKGKPKDQQLQILEALRRKGQQSKTVEKNLPLSMTKTIDAILERAVQESRSGEFLVSTKLEREARHMNSAEAAATMHVLQEIFRCHSVIDGNYLRCSFDNEDALRAFMCLEPLSEIQCRVELAEKVVQRARSRAESKRGKIREIEEQYKGIPELEKELFVLEQEEFNFELSAENLKKRLKIIGQASDKPQDAATV